MPWTLTFLAFLVTFCSVFDGFLFQSLDCKPNEYISLYYGRAMVVCNTSDDDVVKLDNKVGQQVLKCKCNCKSFISRLSTYTCNLPISIGLEKKKMFQQYHAPENFSEIWLKKCIKNRRFNEPISMQTSTYWCPVILIFRLAQM